MDVLLIVLGVFGLFGWLGFQVYQAHLSIKGEIATRLDQTPMPEQFQPFTAIKKVTVDDILRFERLVKEIKPLVEQGKTQITSVQFAGWAHSCGSYLRQMYFIRKHPILTAALVLLMFPAGFFPILIWVGVFALMRYQLSRMEGVFIAYFQGNLVTGAPTKVAQASSSHVDEVVKLHSLLKSGAITDAEYQEAKGKILAKVS